MAFTLRVKGKIKLPNASMVVGLSGWGNAGEVSTFTVKYLIDKLEATKLGEITSNRFYNYQLQRPIVSIRHGMILDYKPPKNDLYYWRDKNKKVSLILLLGAEPHLDWPSYAEAVLKISEKFGVRRIYTIGGYLSDITYTDEPLITASTNNESAISELESVGVELTNYTGPTSVYSEILWQARAYGISVMSLWCAVPIYVSGFYPRAAYYMLLKILKLIGIELNLQDLRRRLSYFNIKTAENLEGDFNLPEFSREFSERRSDDKEPTYRI